VIAGQTPRACLCGPAEPFHADTSPQPAPDRLVGNVWVGDHRQHLLEQAQALNSTDARDWAVRDYRNHLQAVLKRKPATVNNALAAVDDLYTRRGLGPANAVRAEVPAAAPRALGERAQVRYLRAVAARPSPRDQALALVPFYAGARITETAALDVDDVHLSARKGVLRIYGKGQRVREVPIHPQLRRALTSWLHERSDWPGAGDTAALFLNQRGRRLSVKTAHDIITDDQRSHNEQRIRDNMHRLLGGDIPAGGGCDIKTLARQSGVDRTAFYGTRPYAHLRVEFENRLQQAAQAGQNPDPRDAHIARLKGDLATLTDRLAQRDQTIVELGDFKTLALCRLAAQHDEITQLRATLTNPDNIRRLPARSPAPRD